MQITGQNEEEIGVGRGKRTIAEVLLYFDLQFQWNGNSDCSPTCKSVNNKNLSVPKESNFHGGFCSTWRTDTFCKLHSSFQMEAQVFKESSCFCGTWTIFEVKIFPLSRTIEIFSTWQFQIVGLVCNNARLLPFCFLSRLLWETLCFGGVFRIY